MFTTSVQSKRTNLFNGLFHDYQQPAFLMRALDGWSWRSSKTQRPACTIILKTPGALRALLQNPSQLTLGEAFIDGDLDIEGDIFSAFPIVEHLLGISGNLQSNALGLLTHSFSDAVEFWRSGSRHSLARDRSAIARHYDQSVEFYRPWLGDSLVYSCAYFRSPNDCLELAQENKLELICRKLRLSKGDHLFDIGCGWGSLILRAALQHGAEAYGITLSRAQAAVATRRITQARPGPKCRVEFLDYREVAKSHGPFDKISSVGMFEHVGRSNLKQYFDTVFGMLKPGGLFLNHGIARSASFSPRKDSFINEHVFPDGELVTLSEAVRLAESAGLEVRDVENLREHYEQTLLLWVERLQGNSRAILKTVSEKTYRTWLLYMAGSAAAFQRGDIAIYQILFLHPQHGQSSLPMTREGFYRHWPPEVAKLSA